MMAEFAHWFTRRTPRQQLLLAATGAGLLLALLLVLVLLPLHRSLAGLRAAHAQEMATLREVQELVGTHARLASSQARHADSALPLIARVNQSLERQGFQPQRIQQGQQGELQVRVEEVEFDALLVWLHELEQTPGVLLDAVSLSRSGSQSGVDSLGGSYSGRVSASLTLRSL